MNSKRLYILMLAACIAGFAWLYIADHSNYAASGHSGPCLFRLVTGIPCPSCGSTRSVLAMLHGKLAESIYWNPLGIVILALMIFSPAWIMIDLIRKKSLFFHTYLKAESLLRRKHIMIPAILLIVANWIWNIVKFSGFH
jgi:hypothetical protein